MQKMGIENLGFVSLVNEEPNKGGDGGGSTWVYRGQNPEGRKYFSEVKKVRLREKGGGGRKKGVAATTSVEETPPENPPEFTALSETPPGPVTHADITHKKMGLDD